MGTWRDKMAPATFRGVEFHVETADLAGGRRTVRHEYPLRDAPYSEDLGRAGREFMVDGYVVGDDYLVKRDALLAALEEQGPGELVHPYYGTRRVAVASFRVRESSTEGGIATFSISFEETEAAPRFPSSASATADQVAATGDDVETALQDRIAAVEDVAFSVAAVASLATVVTGAAAALESNLSPLLTSAQELAALKKMTAAIVASSSAHVSAPADALDAVLELLGALPTLPEGSGIKALLTAAAFTPTEARPPTTAARADEQARYDLLSSLMRTAMIVHASRLAAVAEWDSYEDAVATRDAIAALLDAEAELADDGTFAQLEQLRAALVRSVPGDSSDLPRLVSFTPPYTVPSLVLAHRLYGNLDREADLVARNRVTRPGFIPGGVELRVLSDA